LLAAICTNSALKSWRVWRFSFSLAAEQNKGVWGSRAL
jgi:hypothetical protein